MIGVVSFFSSSYNPYFLDIAVTCGINITLAVSLNLINGYTGQFSLGHAGFMAVGAYAAAMLTTSFGPRCCRCWAASNGCCSRWRCSRADWPPRLPASSSACPRCDSRATTSPS